MAKGRIITDWEEGLVASVYSDHPKWTAKQIQEAVNKQLRKKNPAVGKRWPGLSAVQKILADIRRPGGEPAAEDGRWSLATLDQDYPIPNGAIPSVLEVWAARLKKKKTLSIREAKWAARLCGVKSEVQELSLLAAGYARAERIFQSMGRPFISGVLDAHLMGFTVKASDAAGLEAMMVLFPTKEEVAEAEKMRQEKPEKSAAEVIAEVEAARKWAAAHPSPVVDASLLAGDSGIPKRTRRGGKK